MYNWKVEPKVLETAKFNPHDVVTEIVKQQQKEQKEANMSGVKRKHKRESLYAAGCNTDDREPMAKRKKLEAEAEADGEAVQENLDDQIKDEPLA